MLKPTFPPICSDEALLRGVLGAHPKIPLEALYLETKSIPIRFIVASRRIMYLHAILQRDDNEMVRRVYEAQKNDPSPGDFTELVKHDREQINLNLSDEEISSIPKLSFRKLVKSKISNAAFRYLQKMQEGHSKMRELKYEKFELMQYLNSPLFSNTNRNLLLALRTRTVRGIRKDFRGLYQDIHCPFGCLIDDTLQHILQCTVIKQNHTSVEVTQTSAKYEDLFSDDVIKQHNITELYNQLLETRNKILMSMPVANNTGPLHGHQAVQNQCI